MPGKNITLPLTRPELGIPYEANLEIHDFRISGIEELEDHDV